LSVVVSESPNLTLYEGGNLDPRLPAGRWFKEMSLTGDASGSVVTSRIRFFTSSSIPNSFCFSLEGFSLYINTNPGTTHIRLSGFSYNPQGQELTRRQFNVPTTSDGGIYAMDGGEATWLPMLMGYRVDGSDCDLSAEYQTNTDTKTYLFSAWGEFWLEHAGEYIGAQQPSGSSGFEASRPVGSQGSMIDVRAGRPPPQVPAVEQAKAAAPFRVYGPDVWRELPAGTPTKPPPVKTSPAAAQDPYAALRRAYIQRLASMGKRVATIPGDSVDAINANFFSLQNSIARHGGSSSQQADLARQSQIARASRATLPPATRSSARSGASSTTTNPSPPRIALAAPVAAPTFSATQQVIKQLNVRATIARLNNPSRPAVVNPSRPAKSGTTGFFGEG